MEEKIFMKKIGSIGLAWICVILLLTGKVYATHNLAGQIVAELIEGTTYRITLTTYTDPAPAGVDRCSADIEIWSVGTNPVLRDVINLIPRANGDLDRNPPSDCEIENPRRGEEVYKTVKMNIYTVVYTFPANAKFELRYFDVARREDIKNISKPGEQAFYVTTIVDIPNPILGTNNTPILLNTPLDEACIGKLWSHNPGGFDPDGDSLAYKIVASMQYDPSKGISPQMATGYRFPDDNSSFDENGPLVQDPITGLMTWRVPGEPGAYNIAYIVEEYRNGIKLGQVLRDMVIFVRDCDNNPPVIQALTDTCVTAGKSVSFDFLAFDPDPVDSIYFRLNNAGLGNNGPFSTNNPPTITGEIKDGESGLRFPYNGLPVSTENTLLRFPDSVALIDTIFGTFEWNTICDNIRKQFYQVDFFANDNISYIEEPGITLLSANHLVAITVIPPPPSELSATKESRQITLQWLPSECDNALGYNVYRKIGEPGFMQDTICCDMSPADAGYELVGFNEGWDATVFVDSLNQVNDIQSESFCYLVTSVFQDEFNSSIDAQLESCSSNEVCINIQLDTLYATNDSVSVTDPENGEIFLSWSQPRQIDDFYPPPYTFKVFRGIENEYPAEEIVTLGFNDTVFTDTGLNTDSIGYNYRIEVFDSNDTRVPMGDTTKQRSSSIFLTTLGDNGTINLSWTEDVPWSNNSYEVFRARGNGDFETIAFVDGTGNNTHTFQDQGLDRETNYCYFVRSTGAYDPTVPDIKQVLINDSQISCSTAEDNTPPCFPQFAAQGDCDNATHIITITKNMEVCENDGEEIALYFAEREGVPYREVARFTYGEFGMDTTFVFTFEEGASLAGCYAITTSDTAGNVSDFSPAKCVEFCPGLSMSNVFTPNGDGVNDFFTPVFFRDIVLKEIVIFDRWGNEVHSSTEDISKLWDGNVNGGSAAKDGVYYYFIKYEELNADGNIPQEAKGWVQLLR